jgi:hypothetical protein
MELRCSRDLALRLGAIEPADIDQHKSLKKAGHLLVRDGETGAAMFWPWAMDRISAILRQFK